MGSIFGRGQEERWRGLASRQSGWDSISGGGCCQGFRLGMVSGLVGAAIEGGFGGVLRGVGEGLRGCCAGVSGGKIGALWGEIRRVVGGKSGGCGGEIRRVVGGKSGGWWWCECALGVSENGDHERHERHGTDSPKRLSFPDSPFPQERGTETGMIVRLETEGRIGGGWGSERASRTLPQAPWGRLVRGGPGVVWSGMVKSGRDGCGPGEREIGL